MTDNLIGLASLGDWNSLLYLSFGFALGTVIFGFRILPSFVRFSFFIISFIFLSTTSANYFAIIQGSLAHSSSADMGFWLIQLTEFSQSDLVQLGVGFGSAIIFSLSAYLALILASWVSSIVFSRDAYNLNSTSRDSLFNLVILLCLVVFFSTDLPVRYFLHLGSYSPSESLSSATFVRKIISLGNDSLLYSLVLVLPLFLASLAVDLFSLVFNRYFSRAISDSSIHSIKLPILIAGLAIMLIPFSEQLAQIMSSSITKETLEGLFR